MSVMERMARLDKRVVNLFDAGKSPEAWRKMASRWWVLLVGAGLYVAAALVIVVLLHTAVARVMALSTILPLSVFFGYLAGQQRAENNRLNGRDPLAKRRPAGL